MAQATTFVFGASKLNLNPTDRRKITPDAEWTQHRTPNPEYSDSTARIRSFGFNDENNDNNGNGTPMNNPAIQDLWAAVERIKLQTNVNRKASRFQTKALQSIQQNTAALMAMFKDTGTPSALGNPAPGHRPLGAPVQGAYPPGPLASSHYPLDAPRPGILPPRAPGT
jgi:hypothetical protein